ncbi:hypothetical protein [Lysinibacillus sp. LZ02]|uniref:hypothetical protein n=1 Tax=Lysinibacillus sp. LZ02 TaxID=3420668 RepID=UPI003D3681DD
MKKYIKIFVGVLISIVVYFLIYIFIDESVGLIIIKLIIFVYTLKLIVWLREKVNYQEIESNLKFVKSSPKRMYILFNWLGEEKSSDRIIYELVGDIIDKPSTLETLRELKRVIENKIGEEMGDYYLIREMLKNSTKYNFGEYFNGLFQTIILGTIGTTIVTLLIKEIKIPSKFDMDIIVLLLDIFIYSFFIIGFISILYQIVSKSKRRANTVLLVLDEIIKEKEKSKE